MLAIIIPYYNLRFFDQTLKSLANQTNKNFKVYIFDDNSPENPENLIKVHNSIFDLEYHFFKDNWGSKSLVKQWHRCIENIKEDWFCILGDDDLLDVNYVTAFYENLNLVCQQKIYLIRYSSIIIDDKGKQIKDLLLHPTVENSKDSLIRKLEGKNRSSLSEYIYRNGVNAKKYFIDFPNAYYSDDLSLLLSTNFGDIFTINNSVLQIRRGNFNLSGLNANLEKVNESEFLFYKFLFNNYAEKFDVSQKKLFLHKLRRLIIRTKSISVYLFVLKNQIKINDFKGMIYFLNLCLNKILCQLKLRK